MTEQLILQQIQLLPETLKQELLDYAEFLARKAGAIAGPPVANRRMMGSALGKYTMTEDFNEPLDDFKDYM